ncbi:hypothetical protein GGR26_002659 [Lewinella marina]|uniref:Uncharacterized protein n=1 Tax=Neolewinella marina TaxID=438751 RepID=A0A2G0CD65_9BACT|nr:hypothetical protein [Neolewinella marina]NJB86882.1 hypothetical protein [Neolewinella marina]PHK97919.1 hypothetical protein CGL56_13985 [Neolewinella marina]
MNSFLALQDQDLAAFNGERRAGVRKRVERELRTAEFIASIVELFGPVMADTLSALSGGQGIGADETYRTFSASEDDDPLGEPPTVPTGPG